jgi:hypothetical protein
MKFSPRTPYSQIKSRNSFRRTLLQRPLHKLSAIASVTHLDGITYRRNVAKSRKSFRRLLLPLFVPVSPLGAHSYKKMGGTPTFPADAWHLNNRSGPNYLCSLSLTRVHQNASKFTQCFLSLTDTQTCNYLCSLSLTKKGGEGGEEGGIDRSHP